MIYSRLDEKQKKNEEKKTKNTIIKKMLKKFDNEITLLGTLQFLVDVNAYF